MKKIKNFISKSKQYFLTNKLSTLVFSLLIAAIFTEVFQYIKSEQTDLNNLIINIIKYSTFILAIEQLRLYKNEVKISNQHLEKKEAAMQAKYYEETIMPLLSRITQNYEQESLKDLNKAFLNTKICLFSRIECENILKESDMTLDQYNEMYHKIIQKPSFLKSYAQTLYDISPSNINKRNLDIIIWYDLYTLKNNATKKKDKDKLDKLLSIKFEEIYEDEAQKLLLKKIKPSQIKDLEKEDMESIGREVYSELQNTLNAELNSTVLWLTNSYHDNISDILNKLEYFSMNFNSGIADEGIVYQSLHQSFRRTIENLYYYIILQNKDSTSKYYTHIIELYSKWNSRYLESKQNEENIKKENIEREESLRYHYTKKERA